MLLPEKLFAAAEWLEAHRPDDEVVHFLRTQAAEMRSNALHATLVQGNGSFTFVIIKETGERLITSRPTVEMFREPKHAVDRRYADYWQIPVEPPQFETETLRGMPAEVFEAISAAVAPYGWEIARKDRP